MAIISRRSRNRMGRNADKNPIKNEERAIPERPMQWWRMIAYLKPYRLRLVFALFALLVSASLSLVFPAVIQNVIDSVFQAGDPTLLNNITLVLIAIFLLRSMTTYIEVFNLGFIGERVVVDIRKNLYEHLQSLSLRFYTESRVGELVSRMSNDVTMMRTALTNNLSTALQQSLIMAGAVVIMVVLNWRLSMFILLAVPIITGIGFGVGIFIRRYSSQVQDEIATATTVAEEVMQNVREVKSFAREDFEIQRYDGSIDRAFHMAVKVLRLNAGFSALMAFMGFGLLALFLWFGGREVLADRLTAGELIAFLIYGISVAGSLAALVNLYTEFQKAIGATKRVFELLDLTPTVQDKADAVKLDTVEGRITFDSVTFSYDDQQEVLHDINLDIAPGEIIALVGPSGAGKSTMFNLIPRFYDATGGMVKLDSVDVRDVTQRSLREQIGIVPQETLLFGGTIRENILYGRLDASEAHLIAAAQAANAHDFIMELPDQYETLVGERGVRLSGGQRQRVAIARAILKDPRILLLDEATSSLDNESEHLVQEALGRLMQNRTTVIIAHRLSTVRVAHRIAVLQRGRIVELGTHNELLAQGGVFAHLYEMQFRDEDLQRLDSVEQDAPEGLPTK
jgi:ATP-binding cassette, subfamily B, bacterial MsbA